MVKRPAAPSLHRMHYTRDGIPKKPVGRAAAERMRAEGWHTYLCPVCGKTHASKKRAATKREAEQRQGRLDVVPGPEH